MTKFYIIRHCEAEGNVKRIFQGSTDMDISELGAQQLEFLGKRFESVDVDVIYSSPLTRAKKTAHAIADRKGMEVKVFEGLREVCGGVIDGNPIFESFKKYPHLADAWDNHPQDFAPENGEPMRDAYERIWAAVSEIVKENKGKSIVATAHGGVIRCLMCRLLYQDINRLKDVPWTENTAITLVEFQDDLSYKIVFSNNHLHLPEKYLPKRSRISSFMKGE